MSAELHAHASGAAMEARRRGLNYVRAYVDAARAFCPACGDWWDVVDNGQDLPVNVTYLCNVCDHQWSPLEG